MLCFSWNATDEECAAVTAVIHDFIADESGATAVEYGLLAALVSIAAGGVVALLGDIALLLYEFVLSGVVDAAS